MHDWKTRNFLFLRRSKGTFHACMANAGLVGTLILRQSLSAMPNAINNISAHAVQLGRLLRAIQSSSSRNHVLVSSSGAPPSASSADKAEFKLHFLLATNGTIDNRVERRIKLTVKTTLKDECCQISRAACFLSFTENGNFRQKRSPITPRSKCCFLATERALWSWSEIVRRGARKSHLLRGFSERNAKEDDRRAR